MTMPVTGNPSGREARAHCATMPRLAVSGVQPPRLAHAVMRPLAIARSIGAA